MSPDSPCPGQDGPRFFGRRKGKTLRVTGRTLVETRLPALAIPEPGRDETLDPASLFSAPPSALWLEVGFGGGEHLAWQAAHHPGTGIIGGEVFLNGIASLLGHLDENGATNVRIFPEDVRRLFPALPDGCLDRVFVLFPDPWPKKRHASRRFIGPDNLPVLARLMKPGAELRVASDDPVYQDWASEHLEASEQFQALAGHDILSKPADWPQTRYEQKALREGRIPHYFRYIRL